MNDAEYRKFACSSEIMELMWDHDDVTVSDLQGIVDAIINKAFLAGRMQAEAEWAKDNLPL